MSVALRVGEPSIKIKPEYSRTFGKTPGVPTAVVGTLLVRLKQHWRTGLTAHLSSAKRRLATDSHVRGVGHAAAVQEHVASSVAEGAGGASHWYYSSELKRSGKPVGRCRGGYRSPV